MKGTKGHSEYLLVNQDSGYLMIDIANAFAEKGLPVTLLTGRLVVRNTKLIESVRVQRIIEYKRRNNLQRIFTWSVAFFQILVLVKIRYRKARLILVSNPPFTFFLPFLVKNSYSLLVFDIFPDAIHELGILKKNSAIIRFWEKANRKVYAKAEKIYTLTQGMKSVVSEYAGTREVEIIDLWSDSTHLRPVPKSKNPFITKHNLHGKFLVMYSGSLGLTQDLNVIIEVARKSLDRKDIFFIIIGDGLMKKQIAKQIKEYNLSNCILLPWQDVKEIPFSFASSSLAVISIGKQASSLSIPSKFYNFLSVGSPILGLASPATELGSLIDQLKVGKCFDPSDKMKIIEYIYQLADNREICREMRNNSLKAAGKYTPENARRFVRSVIS